MKLLNLKYKMHKLVNLVFYLIIFGVGFLLGFSAEKINFNKVISQFLLIDNVSAATITTCRDSINMVDFNIFNGSTIQSDGFYLVGFPGNKTILEGSFKPNTSYTISFYGYRTAISSGFSGYFIFVYTDGTRETIGVDSSSSTFYKLTTPSSKSISHIFMTYGNDHRTYLKDLMLNEGTYKEYEPYGENICFEVENDSFYDFSQNIFGEVSEENKFIYDFITFGLVATCFTLFVLIVGYIFNKFFGG